MNSTNLTGAFCSTRDTLEKAGVADDFFLDLVASRLVVERVGESKNLGWWESRVLSETGRARLSEVTPKTQLKSQISLALNTGQKAESDRLPDNAISLFSFGPQMESRLTAAVDGLDVDENQELEGLENLSIQSLEEGWTSGIINETVSNISDVDVPSPSQDPGQGESYMIGDSMYRQEDIEPNKWRILTTLLRAYGQNTNGFQVPYYSLELELKSESA